MAPARDTDLAWIELTDFSPGIWSNNNLAGGVKITSDNPCKADPSATFRCRALPTGGLGPLPRRQETFGLTTTPDGGNGYTYYVHGLGTWGQVFGGDTDFAHRIEVHLPVSYTTGGSFDNVFKWLRERIYETPQSTETLLTDTDTDGVPERVQYAYLMKTRLNDAASADLPGAPVMVLVFSNYGQGIRLARAQPDPDTPTTNTTKALDPDGTINNYIIRRAVCHQNRVVFARYDPVGRGASTTLSTDENIYWTETNDTILVSTTAAVFVPEVDASITDWSSMSANQLVVVKSLGGGYVLSGDLSDVTTVRLPNLMCPDGSDTVAGCNTGIGWIYSAGDRGLWVWNGGDAARPLSSQLDGRVFTETGGVTFAEDSHRGQCDRWMDLLLAPDLWVCDLEHESWWRLDDPDDAAYPTPVCWWSASKYRQQAIGARATFTDATDDKIFYLYEYGDLAYTYSWQSHPLWMSQLGSPTSPGPTQRLELRQGVVALQGSGTVTVTVLNETGDTSAHTFTIDHTNIRNYRWDIALDAENLVVRIEASGDDGDGPGTAEAPLLHRMFLGYHAAQPLANANS